MSQTMIYLVDDDEAVRDSARMLLEANDFAVQDFASAADLLDSTGGQGADCLVLDIHMPGMNGIELLESLRKRGVEAPVVILTGRFDRTMTDRLCKAKASAILQKPAESGELLGAIHAAIQGAEYARV